MPAPPAILKPLWDAGKIQISPPWADIGLQTGERAFRPWLGDPSLEAGPFDAVLVRCELLRFINVIPYLGIEPGEVVAILFALIRSIGQASLRILPEQ